MIKRQFDNIHPLRSYPFPIRVLGQAEMRSRKTHNTVRERMQEEEARGCDKKQDNEESTCHLLTQLDAC